MDATHDPTTASATQATPETTQATPETLPPGGLLDPPVARALRRVRGLIHAYLALGVLALAVVVVLRNHPAQVDGAVWTRSVIVVLTAGLMARFGARAARGSRAAHRRLRIVSIVTTAAIAVIVALPGAFPVWMRIEQAACGLIMLAVAVRANGRDLRRFFASA